jgi:hypothetical protein
MANRVLSPMITGRMRQAGAAGGVLVLRSGAEITLSFPPDDDKPARESEIYR